MAITKEWIMSATVIIPTTGDPMVRQAIESVLNQSYPTTCYLVGDGADDVLDCYGRVKTIANEFNYTKQ